MVLDHPFFGSLALRLRLLEDASTDTAYTDGVVMGYNPAFIQSLGKPETQWLIAHEVLHLAFFHHTRKNGRDADRWNAAADYAINGVLSEAGFRAPQGALFNPMFAEKSAEEIYDLLPDNGSATESGKLGEVRDAPASCNGDLKKAEAACRVQMAQALQQAKAMGSLPGSIRKLVQNLLYPALDWRELLRQYLEQAACNDYCWLNPSRRYLNQGLILPGLHSKELGNMVVAVDTSGSIDIDALTRFATEISAVLEAFDVCIDVLYCDAKVQGHHQYDRQDLPLKLKPIGGGGTDFRPVFEWVEDNDISPCCMVYLTDLECHRFPEVIPDYPVLWVTTSSRDGKVPFGEVVKLR